MLKMLNALRPDVASAAVLRQTPLAARNIARPDRATADRAHCTGTRLARGEAEVALHQIQERMA